MAGDWIKMRTNLDTDPRVIEIAVGLDVPELHVVGCLWKLWAWADQHTLDGNNICVTRVTLDRFTGLPGFAEMLRKVGWLAGRDGALTFPRFAEHNGQTAKKRAETTERVRKHRNTKSVTDVTRKALPEKRREDKNKEPPSPPEGGGDFGGLVLSSISRADLGIKAKVLDWAERNVPKLSEDLRVKILACSVRARAAGDDPPKLFLYLVRTGLTKNQWQINADDEQASRRPRRKPATPEDSE